MEAPHGDARGTAVPAGSEQAAWTGTIWVISELATGLTVARCVICDIIRYEQLKIDHDVDLSAHNFMAYSYNKRRDNPVSW